MQSLDYDSILEFCTRSAPEALSLEFKEKASSAQPELDNSDKKVIAKAVSAFANSGGGTLVFGVRTARVGDVDVASEIKAISKPEVCRNQVEFVCRTNVVPEIPGLIVTALTNPSGDAGIIVCMVPASELRPHMSTAPNTHTYYRRTFQGDVPMTPFEVQEQVLAVREAVLSPTVRLGRAASFSSVNNWIAVGYSFVFSIENIGSRTCINPFLRVRSSEKSRTGSAYFDQRLGLWKNNVAYGTLVHVDDALKFFSLEFTARVLVDKLVLASSATAEMLLDSIRLYGGEDDLNSPTITDKIEIEILEFEATYGAENAVSQSKKFTFQRNDVAARILVRHEEQIRKMAMETVGIWRADLVGGIRLSLPPEF